MKRKKKLAIVTSHPIQYNAPWVKLLAQGGIIDVKVFYTWSQWNSGNNFDTGFGKVVQWDIPLLDGYEYSFIENVSSNPGTGHFKGLVNPGLNKAIEDWGAEAVLVFGWSFQSHLNCLRFFHKKIPVLFRGDSTLLGEKPGMKRLLRRIFLTWVYRHVDVALYVGLNNKDYFKAHGLKEKQLVLTPHAIDNTRFADPDGSLDQKAKEWRAKLGYTTEDIIILFAGKLEYQKDPHTLIKLARLLNDKRIKILVVGNGNMEAELKQAASGLHNIRFVDFQNQSIMPVVYRLGDIFILPSVSETWGLALNEAMACGLPVIASDQVGGAIDLIRPGENGFIFPRGDVEKLNERLMGCLTGLKEMGQRSKALIKNWSFSQIINPIQLLLNN